MHSEFECFDLLSKYLKRNKGIKFGNAMFLKYLSSSFTVFLKFHKGINEALTEASNIVILLEFQGIYQAPTYQELNYPVNVRWGERRRSHITLQWTSSSRPHRHSSVAQWPTPDLRRRSEGSRKSWLSPWSLRRLVLATSPFPLSPFSSPSHILVSATLFNFISMKVAKCSL